MSRQPPSIDCSRSPVATTPGSLRFNPRRWKENRKTLLEQELFPSALGFSSTTPTDGATSCITIPPRIAELALNHRADELAELLIIDDHFLECLMQEQLLQRDGEHHHAIKSKAPRDKWTSFVNAMTKGPGKTYICRLYQSVHMSYLMEGCPENHFDVLSVLRRAVWSACHISDEDQEKYEQYIKGSVWANDGRGNAVMEKLQEVQLALNSCSHALLTKYLEMDIGDCSNVFEVAQKLYASNSNHSKCTARLVRALLCTPGLGHLVSTFFPLGYSNPPAVRDKILSLRESWPKFAEFIGLSPTKIEAVHKWSESQDQQAYMFMKLLPIPNVKDVEFFLDEALQCARKLGYAVMCAELGRREVQAVHGEMTTPVMHNSNTIYNFSYFIMTDPGKFCETLLRQQSATCPRQYNPTPNRQLPAHQSSQSPPYMDGLPPTFFHQLESTGPPMHQHSNGDMYSADSETSGGEGDGDEASTVVPSHLDEYSTDSETNGGEGDGYEASRVVPSHLDEESSDVDLGLYQRQNAVTVTSSDSIPESPDVDLGLYQRQNAVTVTSSDSIPESSDVDLGLYQRQNAATVTSSDSIPDETTQHLPDTVAEEQDVNESTTQHLLDTVAEDQTSLLQEMVKKLDFLERRAQPPLNNKWDEVNIPSVQHHSEKESEPSDPEPIFNLTKNEEEKEWSALLSVHPSITLNPEVLLKEVKYMTPKKEEYFKEIFTEKFADVDTERRLNRAALLAERLIPMARNLGAGTTVTSSQPSPLQPSQNSQTAPEGLPLARVEAALIRLSEAIEAATTKQTSSEDVASGRQSTLTSTAEVQTTSNMNTSSSITAVLLQHPCVTTTDISSHTSHPNEQHGGSASLQSGEGSRALSTQGRSADYVAASSSSPVSTVTVRSQTADRAATPSPGSIRGQLGASTTSQVQPEHPMGTGNSSPLEATRISSQTSVPAMPGSFPPRNTHNLFTGGSPCFYTPVSKDQPPQVYPRRHLFQEKKRKGKKKGGSTRDADVSVHAESTAETANHYFLLVLCPVKITLNHDDYMGRAAVFISQTEDASDTAEKLFKDGFPYQRYADITRKWVGFGERGVAKIEMESTQAVSNMTISPIDMQCQILRDEVDRQDKSQIQRYSIEMKDTLNHCVFLLRIEIAGLAKIEALQFQFPVKCIRESAQLLTVGNVPRDVPLQAQGISSIQFPREATEDVATTTDKSVVETGHISHPATAEGEESGSLESRQVGQCIGATTTMYLTSDDLVSVSSHLLHLSQKEIWSLGLVLGLYPSTLLPIRESDTFLDDMLLAWLNGADNVASMGGSNWTALVKGLRDQRLKSVYGLAETIEKIRVKYC